MPPLMRASCIAGRTCVGLPLHVRNGLTNRDVAQRLSLSVRTVENHIYKAMAKTETTSRDQLAGPMPGAPNAVPPS